MFGFRFQVLAANMSLVVGQDIEENTKRAGEGRSG